MDGTDGYMVDAGSKQARCSGQNFEKSAMKTDSQLLHDILDELEYDPALCAGEIKVTVKGGVVTLDGAANSFPEKRAAEEAALRVAGIRAVANRIDVPGKSFW